MPASRRRRHEKPSETAALTHVAPDGTLRMVDVSGKEVTVREATARGRILVSAQARALVRAGQVRKGNPLEAARLAGIMAAKRTSEIIPLCHPLPLTHIAVDVSPARGGFAISATVRTTAQTGVEMEALTAVAAAALTLYDMLKAADRGMVITDVYLVKKTGGRSGEFEVRSEK
jgi:cyclic pyranopterin phosphate synthase